MTMFRKDRRKRERNNPVATVVFTVRSGKDPNKVSSPVTGTVRDFSPSGMSVITPRIAPDGIHIMYDTLMTFRNRVDATILPDGRPPIRVQGIVAWFRGADTPPGFYIFGMRFDQEAPAIEDLRLAGRAGHEPTPDR
ncbi:MAG: PilZ domain-containing protein [Deltaproteobacteria bacterium]|nr:MAG: PilZ domain-containing protein [Deltaproteobacteria bacterium]